MYSSITMNLVAAQTRKETLEGRDYLVVPTVMLTEGVHAGSDGPFLYRKEDMAKNPSVWNHKPVTLYHAMINGRGVSACSKDILEKQKAGIIMNTEYDTRLRCESWLDESKMRQTEEGVQVLNAVYTSKMVEVSTGLFHEADMTPGVHTDGKPYNGIIRNIGPDHLAVLLNQIGACSIKDGAGLLRNAKAKKNEMSYENLREQLRTELKEATPSDAYLYVTDIFPAYVVFESGDGKTWKIGYKIRGDKVSISKDKPEEVRRVTTYITANGLVLTSNQAGMPVLEKSFDESLMEMVQNSIGGIEVEGDWSAWTMAYNEAEIIFSQENKKFLLPYSVDGDRIILNIKGIN